MMITNKKKQRKKVNKTPPTIHYSKQKKTNLKKICVNV